MRRICLIEDIPDGASRGFPPAPGGFTGLFAVRRGGQVFVYVNSCPHLGVPLDCTPDRFLTACGRRIVCSTHGAEFRIEDGRCILGPCKGDYLEGVTVQLLGRAVLVSEDAGL